MWPFSRALLTCIPLVVKLVQYVQKAAQEKNWGNLLGLLVELMEEAEIMFDEGATRKEWGHGDGADQR